MKRKIGIKGILLISFLSFSFITILLLVVLEVFLFGDVYRSMKLRSVRLTARELSSVTVEKLESFVSEKSATVGICINVFNDQMEYLAGDHAGGQCLVHMMSEESARLFFDSASETEGKYFECFLSAEEVGRVLKKHEMALPFFHGFDHNNKKASDYLRVNEGVETVLVCEILQNPHGETYFAILSSSVSPVDSAVETIRYLLLVVAIVLASCSVLMAVLLARSISKPIERLNLASQSLPKGEFTAKDVGGYREVEELSASLSETAKEILKTDRLKKELIANVSHDLRTPLTLISGYSEAMRDLPGENTPENLQTVIDEARRLSALVSDLMDISKLDSDTGKLHFERIEIVRFLKECLQSFEKMSAIHGYDIHMDIAPDSAFVEADPIRLQQVIHNLVNNAMNYCGDDRYIGIRVSLLADEVLVEVIDHGNGIKPEKLEYIWERYYRADPERPRSAESTGLGLSIVKRILELHRAKYGVESYVGVGSRFWFSLQLDKE